MRLGRSDENRRKARWQAKGLGRKQQVKEGRLVGYRMSSDGAQRCGGGSRACSSVQCCSARWTGGAQDWCAVDRGGGIVGRVGEWRLQDGEGERLGNLKGLDT